MAEQIKEQVTVFIDDELSSEECEFFVRRLQRDVESRNQYIRYQLIGAAIRGEHVPAEDDLRARVSDALGKKPQSVALEPAQASRGAWRWVAGGSIAAGVAAIALLGLRLGNEAVLPGLRTADVELERVEPPSYVVPLQVPQPQITAPAIQLTSLQYLMHHGQHASTLSRSLVHSNVVAGGENDVAPIDEDLQ